MNTAALRTWVTLAIASAFAVPVHTGRAQNLGREKGVIYPNGKGSGTVRSDPRAGGGRLGGMAPPMHASGGTLLDATRGPVQYDAQRFIGYVNYLAQNLPEELALVRVRQDGAPQLDGETVRMGYAGTTLPNPLAVRLVSQSVACLGTLRSEVYEAFDAHRRSYRTQATFPVGIALLDAQGLVMAFDAATTINVVIYSGGTINEDTRAWTYIGFFDAETERNFTKSINIPSEIARQITRSVGIVGVGNGRLEASGYRCEYSGLCYSPMPLSLEEVRLNRNSLQEVLQESYAFIARSTNTFGTLDASQVGQFCVR